MNTHNPVEDHEKHKEGKPAENICTYQENTVGKDSQISLELVFGLRKFHPGDKHTQQEHHHYNSDIGEVHIQIAHHVGTQTIGSL